MFARIADHTSLHSGLKLADFPTVNLLGVSTDDVESYVPLTKSAWNP